MAISHTPVVGDQARSAAPGRALRTMFWVQKYVTITTFICGLFLNLALIFFGSELTLQHVFTRQVDLFLLTLMFISMALGWRVLPALAFRSRAARIFQIVILVYFVMLCLVHGVVVQIMGNTALYIDFFLGLPGYPYIASAVFIVMLAFSAHLRLRSA